MRYSYWVLVSVFSLLLGSFCFAQNDPVPESSAQEEIEQVSETQVAQPGGLSTLAEKFIEAAKSKMQVEAEMREEQARERKLSEAQKLAIDVSRHKLKERQAKTEQAARQVIKAREGQLKAMYSKATELYNDGNYQKSIEVLQQMALMDPAHPLIITANKLIERAEHKRFEQRLRASLELPSQVGGAIVPELEQLLSQKRMELETVFKYAKAAMRKRHYDNALKLLTAILVQDPNDREAKQLIEHVHTVKLRDEKALTMQRILRDEKSMINEILNAQKIPHILPSMLPEQEIFSRSSSSPFLTKLQVPISFEFNDVSLGDVLGFLADAASVSIIPSPALDLKNRMVSLKVTDLPLELAIKYLAKSQTLSYRIDEDAIVIATEEEFSNEPVETRVFFLRNGLGPFALETSAVPSNPMMAMDSIRSLIEQTVPRSSDSRIVVDERSGALIITNTKANLVLVERLLSQLDVTPTQILIEARFIELTMTELEHMGFESVLTAAADLKKTRLPGGIFKAATQIASGGGFKFPALSREDEGLNLTIEGILTPTKFESVLHMLKETNRSKTLSAPRLTTLNNQPATIKVVDEFRYPTRYEVSLIQFDINGDGDFDDAGETEFANVPVDFQKRDVGILLHVTPSVGEDQRTITLVLAPEVSQFSQFRDLGGGVTVPEFTSSQLTTTVVLDSGHTVVLGGLMQDSTSETISKIPFLGDLPIVGGLFRQKSESSTRKNLLIFITARILAPRGQTT